MAEADERASWISPDNLVGAFLPRGFLGLSQGSPPCSPQPPAYTALWTSIQPNQRSPDPGGAGQGRRQMDVLWAEVEGSTRGQASAAQGREWCSLYKDKLPSSQGVLGTLSRHRERSCQALGWTPSGQCISIQERGQPEAGGKGCGHGLGAAWWAGCPPSSPRASSSPPSWPRAG